MKTFLFEFLYRIGAVRLATWWNRDCATILCYHGVTKRVARGSNDPHGLHIQVERFAKQLDYLRRHHHVISLTEFLERRQRGEELPSNCAILTFDDGYRNFLTSAIGQLQKRKLPATVFLITDRVREGDEIPGEWTPADDETYLSWSEVRSLQAQGVDFGSHTRSHRKLASLDSSEIEAELRGSQISISTRLSSDRLALAYPFGDYSTSVVEQARKLGYTCALTTDDGPNPASMDLFTLRRVLIGDNDDEAAFGVRVSGLISAISRRKRQAG